MTARYDPEWIASMLSEGRAQRAAPHDVLSEAGLTTGMTVVDIGCGPGFFTIPAAQIVGPPGHVFAVDVEATMLAYVEDRADDMRLENITAVLSGGHHIPLPDACADLVICALLIHDVPLAERPALVAEAVRLCGPGGAILIIEWQPDGDQPRWNRLSPETVHVLLSEAGLRVEDSSPLGSAVVATHEEGMYRVLARKTS